MSRTELLGLMRAEPFEPFRIHMADGRAFDVLRQFHCMVGKERVVVPDPARMGPDGISDGPIYLSLEEVRRVEKLTGQSVGLAN